LNKSSFIFITSYLTEVQFNKEVQYNASHGHIRRWVFVRPSVCLSHSWTVWNG